MTEKVFTHLYLVKIKFDGFDYQVKKPIRIRAFLQPDTVDRMAQENKMSYKKLIGILMQCLAIIIFIFILKSISCSRNH